MKVEEEVLLLVGEREEERREVMWEGRELIYGSGRVATSTDGYGTAVSQRCR